MRTSHNSSSSFLFSSLRESLVVALSFALATFLFAAISAHAQEPPTTSGGSATSTAPGWVVIPVEEYQHLRARAFPTERDPDPPPVEATLTRVDYDLHIVGDLASGRASLTVDVIKDGWVRVAIPAGLLVREARLDGKLVSLVPGGPGKGGNQLSAVLSHAGRALLQLDIAMPVNASAGEESISLPSTASGVTRASIQLARQDVDVRLSGGLLAEKQNTGADSKWLAYARGGEPLTLTWKRKMEEHRQVLPLRLRGSLIELLGLGEDATSVYAEVSLEIMQGAAKEVRIQLPDKVTVNQVTGAMVADWEVKSGELAVTFLEPVEQSARFVISGETRTPREGQVEVPLLRLLGTERDSGGVAVEVLGAGEIKDQKPQGLESVDAADLGDVVASRQSPSLVAFRFRSGETKSPRALTLNVARYEQQAVMMANIEEARYQVLLSNEGKTLVQARYAVRNNQRNFLKLTLPAGATIWSASLAGRPVRPGQAPDGGLLLPLEKSRAGDEAPVFTMEVLYLVREGKWSDRGKAHLALPALDLPISRTGLVVYHSPQFHVTSEPGSFRAQPYTAPMSPAFRMAAGIEGGVGGGINVKEKDYRAEYGVSGLTSGGPITGGISVNGPLSAPTKALMDDYRAKFAGGKEAKVLPVHVSFPAFGTSLFLVSELTAENQVPSIEFSYQREKDKKDGGR
jgi:hypothetical protein